MQKNMIKVKVLLRAIVMNITKYSPLTINEEGRLHLQ